MNIPQSTTAAERSLGRDLLYAARYYLGNRWTLVAVAGIAIALGLSLGGWGWLVAAGLAPILLATLPCLIMCGFGVCMMCRGEKKTTASGDAANSAASSAALGVAKMDQPAAGGSSCCGGGADEPQSPQVKQLHSINGRKDSHA